nr:hypothetical protein [Tessaracoccus coleopterorum]
MSNQNNDTTTRHDIGHAAVQAAVDEFETLHGRKPVILKDMDNTDYDWSGRLNEILLDLDPTFPVVPEGQRLNYNHFAATDDYDRSTLHRALNRPDFYHNMPRVPGAIESTEAFLDAGCPVFHVSTPALLNPGCVAGKVADLTRDYGPGRLKRLILTTDKTVIRGDVLFDDKPEICGTGNRDWRHVLVGRDFNRYVRQHPCGWTAGQTCPASSVLLSNCRTRTQIYTTAAAAPRDVRQLHASTKCHCGDRIRHERQSTDKPSALASGATYRRPESLTPSCEPLLLPGVSRQQSLPSLRILNAR